MSTYVNIFLELNWLKSFSRIDYQCVLIDFTSAYNTK